MTLPAVFSSLSAGDQATILANPSAYQLAVTLDEVAAINAMMPSGFAVGALKMEDGAFALPVGILLDTVTYGHVLDLIKALHVTTKGQPYGTA